MSGLNPGQQEAVDTLSGPILVLAGAGTGKTRVITFRIAKLIKSGIQPDRILGVTFTNKAATEMQQRLGGMLSKRLETRPLISTFHSLCVRILRRHIEVLGYPTKFAIYNRGDQEALARTVLRDIRVTDKMLAPGQLLYHIGGWKCRSLTPEDAAAIADDDQQHLAAMAYSRYQRALKNCGAVDFDDLLLLTERMFAKNEDVRLAESNLFDHVLIDEYQDTNTSQYRIVKALTRDHENLCVVGDDDQSIYGWRGAEVEHILSFAKDWPAAKVIRLEDNYRSTEEIIKVANKLIAVNKTRHGKVLRAAFQGGDPPAIKQYPNEAKEAAETVQAIKRRLQLEHREPRDFAILFRTNEQPRVFETELRKASLPYVLVGGMSFFDRKEVKDILAYLRMLDGEPDEVSILRVINTPPRGIGKKSVELLLDHCIREKVPLWDMITGAAERPKLPPNAVRGCEQLANVVEDVLADGNNLNMVDMIRDLIQRIDYEGEVNRLYSEPDDRLSRWAVVEQMVNALAEYEESAKKPNLTQFLDRLLLGDQSPDDEKEKQLKKNAIMLMTMHSAKGLEFPEVYIVGLEEGILPHHRSLQDDEAGVDEERRLAYVGVTRAEEKLTLSLSLSRMKWGKPHDTIPSRFLYELMGKTDHPNYLKKPRKNRGRKRPAAARKSK